MAESVAEIIRDIDRRLSELRAEGKRLESARSALVDGSRRPRTGSRPAAPTPRSAGSTPRRGRPRAGGGSRADQALQAVRANPGITLPQIATRLKIAPNYLYRVMPKLIANGQVRREGKGFQPVS